MITMPKRTDIQNMKRLLLIASVLCFLPVIVFGQTSYVQNGTEYTLYLRAISGGEYRQAPPEGLLPVGVNGDLEGFAYDRESFQLATVQIAAELFADQEFVRITSADLSDVRTLSPSDVTWRKKQLSYPLWQAAPPICSTRRSMVSASQST